MNKLLEGIAQNNFIIVGRAGFRSYTLSLDRKSV